MKHKKIQKKFLLYIDGDLPESEKILIEQHLNECVTCNKQYEVITKIWKEERKLEQPLPSPALWYDLKNRMEKEAEKSIPLRAKVGNTKLLFNSVITVGVVVFAIFIGSRFGGLLSPQTTSRNVTYAQSKNIRDEFGMSYFDAVPPNSIAKDIFITGLDKGGLQK